MKKRQVFFMLKAREICPCFFFGDKNEPYSGQGQEGSNQKQKEEINE
jgi:hypothetical protein